MSLLSPVTAVVLGWIFLGQRSGDGADGIDRGAGERAVYPARAGASGGGSKTKSPVTGLDIAACGVGGGSQTSHPQAACPAAPSATIRLFRQLGGHMDWLPV